MKFNELLKSPLNRHPGESRGPEALKVLDSGFRRNDRKTEIGLSMRPSDLPKQFSCLGVKGFVL